VASWLTNRESDTRLLINEVGEAPLDELRLDEDQGAFVHIVSPTGLKLDTEYEFIVTSRLVGVGVDELIEQATLTEGAASFVKTGTFRTRSERQPSETAGATRDRRRRGSRYGERPVQSDRPSGYRLWPPGWIWWLRRIGLYQLAR